jgi:Protein of unknown function (DUF998)
MMNRAVSKPAALSAIAGAGAALIFLASLHVLSPEFSPSWRMVSEYANGSYGWVLSLMFAVWGFSTLALAFAVRSQLKTRSGKAGLAFLTVAGIGEAMAAAFDINHDVLHSVAGALGIIGLPIGAMLVSINLSRTQPWSIRRKPLLWTANLTWVSLVLLAATFPLMVATFVHATGGIPSVVPKALPPGVIAWVGWANRLLVVMYCAWVATVAWQAIRLQDHTRAVSDRREQHNQRERAA